MLEQVRKPGASGLLVLRAHVIPQLEVDDRRRVVFFQHHRQAVRESRQFVFEFRWTDGANGAGRSEQDRRRADRVTFHHSIIY